MDTRRRGQNAPEAEGFALFPVLFTRGSVTSRRAENWRIGNNRNMNFYNPSAARPALVVPPVHERQLPAKSQETTATNPWPLALLAQNLKNYVDKVPELWVEAQVASLNGRGGNVFMELKDVQEDFSFTLALFGRAGSGLAADVTVGSRIVTRAKPSLWKNGKLSLIGKEVYAVGTGNLHEQLQRLREALAAEGLFADARKKPLPMLPNRVGLITGRDSDAEKDVIRNASLRWPGVTFEVRNTRVQGEGAAAEVIAALAELDAHPEVDVIVIARGGGSFEDLLPHPRRRGRRHPGGLGDWPRGGLPHPRRGGRFARLHSHGRRQTHRARYLRGGGPHRRGPSPPGSRCTRLRGHADELHRSATKPPGVHPSRFGAAHAC